MTHYEQMREESRMINQESNTRTVRLLATIGVITGSVFVSEEAVVLISLIPVIIFLFYTREIIADIWLFRIQAHITDIQKRLDVDEFNWESKYGSQSSNNRIESIPEYTFSLLWIGSYVLSCWIGINSIRSVNTQSAVGIEISPKTVLLFYIGLAVLGGLSLLSHYKVYSAEKRDFNG